MNDSEYYNQFYIGLAIAAAIVVIAATLLILVWLAARRILKLAASAITIVVKIKENTMSIWELQQTNNKAVDILSEADTIEDSAVKVAQALHETEKK